MSNKKQHNALPSGYKLHWYVIKEVLGRGGFGITYLAGDTNLKKDVAIKEYMPVESTYRDHTDSVNPLDSDDDVQYKWGLDRFISEAQTLAKFEHPNIVRVFSVFQENNTGYMVMNYEKGVELQSLIQKGNTLGQKELLNIVFPLLDGLEKIHEAGFVHRDIKPQNILIRPDGSPVLIDFGSARQSLGQMTKTLTSLVSPGYAPFEQYYSKSDKQGPWTDIYALAATLYRCISGRSPISAVDRSEAIVHGSKDIFVSAMELGKDRYSEHLLKAIDHGLKFRAEDRPQSIAEWSFDFREITKPTVPIDHEDEIATVLSEIEKDLKNIDEKEKSIKLHQKNKLLITGIAGVLFVSLLLGIFLNMNYFSGSEEMINDTVSPEPVIEKEDTGKGRNDKNILDLLNLAQNDIQNNRFTKPDKNNAHYHYMEILKIDSENVLAIQGLNLIVDKLTNLAVEATDSDQLALAEGYIKEAELIAPDNKNLAQARKNLEVMQNKKIMDVVEKEITRRKMEEEKLKKQQDESLIRNLLLQADINFKELRLISPEGNNAHEYYRKILAIDPDNTDANEGIKKITGKFLDLARQSADIGAYGDAMKHISSAEEISPGSENIKRVADEIELKRKTEEHKRTALEEQKKREYEQLKKELENEVEKKRIQEEQRMAKISEEENLRLQQEAQASQEKEKALQQQELIKQEELEKQASSIGLKINQIESKYQNMNMNTEDLTRTIQNMLTGAGFNISDINLLKDNGKIMELNFNPKNTVDGKLIGWHLLVSVSQGGNVIWSSEDERINEGKQLYGVEVEPWAIENLVDAKNSFLEMVRKFIVTQKLN